MPTMQMNIWWPFYLSGLSSTQGSYTRSTLPQKTISIQETSPSFWKCRIALKSISKSADLIQFPTPYNFANLGEHKNIIKQQNLLSRRNWLRFTVMLINLGQSPSRALHASENSHRDYKHVVWLPKEIEKK